MNLIDDLYSSGKLGICIFNSCSSGIELNISLNLDIISVSIISSWFDSWGYIDKIKLNIRSVISVLL